MLKKLRARLHRADCPDSLTLAEYHQGLLRGNQALLVRAHIARCPYCRKEIAQLEAFLAPRPGLMERARVIIASLVSGSQSGQPAPALGLRGSGQVPLTYAAGEMQIILTTQGDARRPERRSLVGLVMGAQVEGIQVRLLTEGETLMTTQVDDLGNFVFADLHPGVFELHLVSEEDEVRIPDVTVE